MHVEGTRTVLRRRVFLTNCTLSKQSCKMDCGWPVLDLETENGIHGLSVCKTDMSKLLEMTMHETRLWKDTISRQVL